MRGGPYGKMGAGGKRSKTVLVHRVAFEAWVGPIPAGYQIDHICRRTLCCNPKHLRAVPSWVNNALSDSATSRNIGKEECPQGHPYDEKNTGWRKGKNWRFCRACAREAQRAKRDLGLTYPQWLATQKSRYEP